MRTVFIHVYCSCLFTVKFNICSKVVLMVQGLHLCIRLGYSSLDIWLGLGLRVTDRVSVRHTTEILVALFTLTDTRPLYKALVLFQFSSLG